MIRITKPVDAPPILTTRGATLTARLCIQHDAGERDFAFDSIVYGHESVKAALMQAQHGKCCFCERKVGEDGDVEHFRPKGGVCQSRSEPMSKPGYYWLAYLWENLFLSCGSCNSRNKRNLFPLIEPANRARTHADSTAREQPLFLSPADDDPETLIGWRAEIAFAVGGNTRATTTINELGLNRKALRDICRDHLRTLARVMDSMHIAEKLLIENPTDPEVAQLNDDLQAWLADVQKDNAEFTAMSRAAVRARSTV